MKENLNFSYIEFEFDNKTLHAVILTGNSSNDGEKKDMFTQEVWE